MILVASNSLSLEAWASSSTVRCPLARARRRSSSGWSLPSLGRFLVTYTRPWGMRCRKCWSSSIFRMASISKLWVGSWTAGPVFSSGSWSTRVNAPSRARTMAWKMSETCWVTQAQRACGWSSPRSTRARPTRLGGLSRRASSTSWRAAWPRRTSTSLSRSAGSSLLAPWTSPSLRTTERSPPGAWSRRVPVQWDWPRKAMRSERGKPEASPMMTTRGPLPRPPSGGWRRAARRSGAVGSRTKLPWRAASSPEASPSGATRPPDSTRMRAVMVEWGASPVRRGPGAAGLLPVELVVHGDGEDLRRGGEVQLSPIDEDGGRGVDPRGDTGCTLGLSLLLVGLVGERLLPLRGRNAGLDQDLLEDVGGEAALVLEDGVVDRPELPLVAREERGLGGGHRVGVLAQGKGHPAEPDP